MAKLAGALGVVLGCAAFTLFARHFEGYFPLAEKITLEYELVRQKPDGSIEKGRLFVTNLAPMRLANKTVVPRRYDLKMQDGLKQSYSIFFHNDQEGILFFGFQTDKEAQPQVASPPYYYLKNPLKVGASWGEGDSPKGKVESLSEAVTVPAGTFTNCLRIKITFPPNKPLAEGLFWYGEKVGIVKSAYLYRNALKEEFRLVSIKE
jgi:hypothetical protein